MQKCSQKLKERFGRIHKKMHKNRQIKEDREGEITSSESSGRRGRERGGGGGRTREREGEREVFGFGRKKGSHAKKKEK